MQVDAPLLRYRRREIRESDLAFIRQRIAASEGWTRPGLARALCDDWGWFQPNGAPAVYACQELLKRLEDWGHVQLPRRIAPRQGRVLPLLPRELVALPWAEVHGEHADLDRLVVRPIEPDERLGWRLFIDRYHYLGDKPIVGEHLLYAAFLGTEMVALLAWASAALHAPLREQFIGWSPEARLSGLHLVANNVRFLVPPWVRVRHLASKVLALNLRRLSSDWQARWNHPLLLAETFVDTSRFRGTSYRAANWTFLGHTAGRSKRGNSYLRGASPKALYIYELHRKARRILREGWRSPAARRPGRCPEPILRLPAGEQLRGRQADDEQH